MRQKGAAADESAAANGANIADDPDRLFYIPYTGRPGDYYDDVSIVRVIRGEVPADYWAGRIVLIGPYAAALQDAYFTPIDKGKQMYGVEIQANIIQSFLENNAKKEIPEAPQIAALFVLCAAALFMMVSSVLIRHTAAGQYSPAKILQSVNQQICARNPEEMFVTVWLGILEIATGKLTAANAGHEYPMIKRAGESFEMLRDRHGLVIGAMKDVRYKDYELTLEPGAKLFVYTDGVSEAVDRNLNQFSTDRILEALRSNEDRSPREILEAVNKAVHEFAGNTQQYDDLTMMCVEYKGV